jgi:predicted enzyme related to lactoylglutathione lyase
MNIQTVTITVSDMAKSKEFYEGLLGFTADEYYAPTNWQPFRFGNQLFGIREMPDFKRTDSFDIINFETDDIDKLWAKVQPKAPVIEELAPTPWGSYRFVIADPDGYHVAFVAKQEAVQE